MRFILLGAAVLPIFCAIWNIADVKRSHGRGITFQCVKPNKFQSRFLMEASIRNFYEQIEPF